MRLDSEELCVSGRRRGAQERGYGDNERAGFAPVTRSNDLEGGSGSFLLLIWTEPTNTIVPWTVRVARPAYCS